MEQPKTHECVSNDPDEKLASVECLLQEAIDYRADTFDKDEDIDGAGMVEWFSQWRKRVKLALSSGRPHCDS